MRNATKYTIFLTTLLFSAAFLIGITSNTHYIRAQTTIGGPIEAGIKSITDQIVAGGQSIVRESVKGGVGFLNSVRALFGVHDIGDHITALSHDLANGNNTGASSELKMANKALLSDSTLLYGLGQIESKIAQNSTAVPNVNDRLLLAAIGDDLKNVALNSEGIRANSTTNSSTISK